MKTAFYFEIENIPVLILIYLAMFVCEWTQNRKGQFSRSNLK